MRGLQPRSFILLPLAIVFIATGDTIQLRNWKFRRAFRHELSSFRIAECFFRGDTNNGKKNLQDVNEILTVETENNADELPTEENNYFSWIMISHDGKKLNLVARK